MMKAVCRALALALLLAPAASFATKLPLPIEGASVTLSARLQTQFLVNEAGSPAGDSPSYDVYVRRTRIELGGDINPNFNFLIRVDNANFGKFGNFSGRMILQDAWFAWSPTGSKGGTAFMIDAGLMQIPVSHYELGSSINYVTADLQTDAFRIPATNLPGFRDVGVQLRGWSLNRKLGFRGGVFAGYAPVAASGCDGSKPGTCLTPKRNPAFRGLVNFDIIGSEEGSYYYNSYRWGKDPIVGVSVAGNYQSLAVRNAFNSLTDHKLLSTGLFIDLPSGDTELVGEVTAYFNGNGTASANTGLGLSGNLGYRFGTIAPYVGYDYFQSSDCGTGLSATDLATCNKTVDTADSRNLKVGLNLFFNKHLNHMQVEFGVNHGQSQWGPGSITASNAGYVPLSLDPVSGSTSRRAWNAKLANPAFKSLLVHYSFYF